MRTASCSIPGWSDQPPPPQCRPSLCRHPWCRPPFMQTPLMQTPLYADTLDADPPLCRHPWCKPPFMQTPLMQTPLMQPPLYADTLDAEPPLCRHPWCRHPFMQTPWCKPPFIPWCRPPSIQTSSTPGCRPPGCRPTGCRPHLHAHPPPWSCDLWCMLGSQPLHQLTEWHTGVKTLPCPKLRLRTVKIWASVPWWRIFLLILDASTDRCRTCPNCAEDFTQINAEHRY